MTLDQLPPFDSESNAVHVIIDTPRGSRNKYSWNEKWKLFELTGVLPAGAVFPFDFGFIPQTRGGDGDPLDVLVLLDEPAVAGSLVRTRLIGSSKPSKPRRAARHAMTAWSEWRLNHETIEITKPWKT